MFSDLRSKNVAVDNALSAHGYALLKGLGSTGALLPLLQGIGIVVGEEEIALRHGAHAYVARPGPVPFHTDQPQVEVACWHCLDQDDLDGASLLLDSRSAVERLSSSEREILRHVLVACPPVAGGAPVLRFPVLRQAQGVDLVFASPWLEAVNPTTAERITLARFMRLLQDASTAETVELRLSPGDVLLVDNQRVLHGRRALRAESRRRLHRRWLIRHETAALE